MCIRDSSSSTKIFENRLRFDKVTESLKVGTFFETQCILLRLRCDKILRLNTLIQVYLYSSVGVGRRSGSFLGQDVGSYLKKSAACNMVKTIAHTFYQFKAKQLRYKYFIIIVDVMKLHVMCFS